MKIKEVREILEAKVVCCEESIDLDVNIGCSTDLLSHVLLFRKEGSALLLTGLTTPQVVYTADAVNIKAICFVRDKQPQAETVELARERKMILLTSGMPMYAACGRLYKAGLLGSSEYGS